jgi:transcriptional regulator with XRE-family HTH domain
MNELDKLLASWDGRSSEYEAERLILDTTEQLIETMKRNGITRTELARRIGKSKGHVSQLLNGERNMTLRTLAELAFALDSEVAFEVKSTTTLTQEGE